MGSICIYKGLSNECYKEIKGSGKICDILKGIYPTLNLNNFILIKQGSQISSDYEIKDNEVVFIREAPHATGCMIACAVIGVVTAAVSAGLAIKNYYDQKDLQEEMEDAERDSKNLSQQVKQLPFVKGAANRTALGYNIPFVMGSVYHTPYLLTNGFYSISGTNGENQFWNAILVGGYANMLCNNVSIGTSRIVGYNQVMDVPRVTSSGETTEKVYYMKESDDPYMFHSGSYYSYYNRIEIRTEDEMTLAGLDEKVSCTSYGDEIPHNYSDTSDYKNGLVKQLASNTRKVEICVNFNGLRQYDDGKWKSKKVELSFYWANDASSGSPTWHKFDSISPDINTDKTARFSVSYTFSATDAYQKDISIKIVRETPKNEQSSQEDCYLCYINCWQYDAWKSTSTSLVPCRPLEQPWRDKTLRLGLRIISNDSTKDSLDKINFMAYGMARIVLKNEDGSYYWSTEKYPTRNPASWVLEVLTSDVHKHSQYADSEIDLDSLKDLYLYCADNEFYCDGIVTDDTKKLDLITQILTECNATMYMDSMTGKWTFAIEKEQTVPVALLNEQSIKNITVSKNFERQPYAQKVTFTDRTNWSVNTVYISKTGTENSADVYDKQNVITESTVKYITTYDHCYKYTKRQIARQLLQPREVTVDVGNEGDYYPLYSMVLLQMQHLKIGLSSGVIHKAVTNSSGQIEKIQTSDICDFSDTSKTYGVIVQSATENGKETLYLKVTGTGKTRVLALETPITCNILPEYGNIYSFGYLDDNGEFTKITNKMTIYGAKPSNNGWQLTLKDYSDDLFTYGDIPSYVPNLSENREIETRMPTPTYGDIQSAVTEVKAELSSTIDVNKYTLDLSPEAQSIPVNASGVLASSWFTISAYLYYKDALLTDDVTYKAYLSDGVSEVGTWNGNTCTISSTFLKGDILYLIIRATYTIDETNSIKREVQAQVSRLYGQGTNVYKMLFPDGEKVRIDDTGTVLEPTQIRAEKRVANGSSETPTVFGKITIETVPNGKEEEYSPYVKVEDEESYSSKKKYYVKTEPFLLKTSDGNVVGAESNVAGLFFKEIDL